MLNLYFSVLKLSPQQYTFLKKKKTQKISQRFYHSNQIKFTLMHCTDLPFSISVTKLYHSDPPDPSNNASQSHLFAPTLQNCALVQLTVVHCITALKP